MDEPDLSDCRIPPDLASMVREIFGKPCVAIVDRETVYVSRKIDEIFILFDQWGGIEVYAICDWVDPIGIRPDELTNGIEIGASCFSYGKHWWFDNYFQWWFVFRPEWVERSIAGDHSWVEAFVQSQTQG